MISDVDDNLLPCKHILSLYPLFELNTEYCLVVFCYLNLKQFAITIFKQVRG